MVFKIRSLQWDSQYHQLKSQNYYCCKVLAIIDSGSILNTWIPQLFYKPGHNMDFLTHFNSLSFFPMEFRMEYKKSVSVTAWVELSQCYCFVF